MFTERKLTDWLLRETSSSGVRRVVSLRGALASEVGSVRSDNQDKAIMFRGVDITGRPYAVAIVADGIGGMKDGARCASLAIASFTSALTKLSLLKNISLRDRLIKASNLSNEAVYREFQGQGGSTLVAVMFVPNQCPIWVSAGDSRIYLHSENDFGPLTIDDTIAGQLNKSGRVSAEQSKILQFVGMGRDFEPHIGEVKDAPAGQLFLTTDGIHYLEDGSNWFKNLIQCSPDAAAASKRLIDVAKWCGGPDNATLAVVGFPVQFPEQLKADDALQVWDAFGELHIQLPCMPTQNKIEWKDLFSDFLLPTKVQDSYVEKNNNNLNLQKKIELENTSQIKRKSNRKKTTSKNKLSRSKKKTEEGVPQLDIEFSPKTKD